MLRNLIEMPHLTWISVSVSGHRQGKLWETEKTWEKIAADRWCEWKGGWHLSCFHPQGGTYCFYNLLLALETAQWRSLSQDTHLRNRVSILCARSENTKKWNWRVISLKGESSSMWLWLCWIYTGVSISNIFLGYISKSDLVVYSFHVKLCISPLKIEYPYVLMIFAGTCLSDKSLSVLLGVQSSNLFRAGP